MRRTEMKKSWITLLGVLGIVSTSLGFTVERSSSGGLGSQNWSSPIFRIDQRAPIEEIFSGELHSAHIENILRDYERKQSVKLPEEKCSSTSEDPQRVKRSDDLSDPTNRSTIAKKIDSESKKTTILPSSSAIETSRSTIVSSSKEAKSSESRIVTSPKEMKTSESTIETSTIEASTNKTKILASTIEDPSKEVKPSGSTITPKKLETSEPIVASSPKEKKNGEPKIVSPSTEMETSTTMSKSFGDIEVLKNVVFLLIDGASMEREPSLMLFEAGRMFPVRRFLESCDVYERVRHLSREHDVFSLKNKNKCDCERLLRTKIGSLLSWARHIRNITTGTISTTNFSIPSSLGFEIPPIRLVKEFEDDEQINAFHPDFSHSKSEPNDEWRLIDVEKPTVHEKRSMSPASSIPTNDSTSKQDGTNGSDGIWDVFDMFSRIRIAFFRMLLESLGNIPAAEDDFKANKPCSVQPSLVDLMTDSIRELKSLSNDNGYLLVAVAPKTEMSSVMELLRREISLKDTLLVVSGICSPTKGPVPFAAYGPGEKILAKARVVSDIPKLIKSAIIDGCVERNCENEPQADPEDFTPLESSPPRHAIRLKRVGRAGDEEKVSNPTTVQKMSSDRQMTVEQKTATHEKSTKQLDEAIQGENVTASPRKTSGASDVGVDDAGKLLGIVTSVVTMLALNFS